MLRNQQGKYLLAIDSRLHSISAENLQLKITEEQFCNALKGYKLDEALIFLGGISGKLFDKDFVENEFWKKERIGFIVHKLTGLYVTDFAIEYISNLFLISGSNDFKNLSIKSKDNILGILNIYFSNIIQPHNFKSASSLLVPMYYQQLTSQQDIKDTFVRQWLIFQKVQDAMNPLTKIDLNSILLNKTGVNIHEYIRLSFAILAITFTSARFNIGKFSNPASDGLGEILTNEKFNSILALLSITPQNFRLLDKKLNPKLSPKLTKYRYNPLWEKPIIQLTNNDFVVPSISAYIKGAFRGLFWIFENNLEKSFRDYFGALFEGYVGLVLKDMYGDSKVVPGVPYGSKKEPKIFFDWIIDRKGSIILFEAKGYQFPLTTLQTGDPELIRKEVFKKIVKTIKQMYERIQDTKQYDELKPYNKKGVICVGVFYDIPLVSTDIYDHDIKAALEGLDKTHPGIKEFEYTLISIEELENYAYVKDFANIEDIAKLTKRNHSGIIPEISKIFKENNLNAKTSKNLLDKKFNEFFVNDLKLPYSED